MINNQSLLVLEDGTVFEGTAVGVPGIAVGELIFNTANVGYQEVLTDPSYAAQLVIFTTPHIGNTGCHSAYEESTAIHAAGLILREKPLFKRHWQVQNSLQYYLEEHHVVGIAEVDTRCLTRLLRTKGNLRACIVSEDFSITQAQQLANAFQEVHHARLIEHVTTKIPYQYVTSKHQETQPHIVVYDFGVKQKILRSLAAADCTVTVVPANCSISAVQALQPDGIVLSNGPGDPLAYTQIVDSVKTWIATSMPILGICLGHQLLGLALGATIEKLKFGHHGINHPIKELRTGRVFISSQNHNYVLSTQGLPAELEMTHQSLFDHSIQGIKHKTKSLFGVQGHPEGGPGPTELSFIFTEFLAAIKKRSLSQDEMVT